MKIRSDFVTNSSSSSFVMIRITSDTFADIIRRFKNELPDNSDMCDCGDEGFSVDGNNVTIYMGEEYADCPEKLSGLVNAIARFFDDDVYTEDNDDEEELALERQAYEENYDESEANVRQRVAHAILENKENIEADVESVEFVYGSCGYGGDDESRFYEDSYPEHRLKEIRAAIMADKGYSSESEVTTKDFDEYVCDKSSTEESRFEYDRATGKEEYTKDFYLL